MYRNSASFYCLYSVSAIEFDLSSSGGFLIAVRPEAGFRFKLSNNLQLNVGVNMLYSRLNTGQTVTGKPALRVGLRLGG